MFQNLRITTKYPVAIVTLALLASVLTGILAYSTTSSELGKVAGEKLSALLEARKDALENYFAIISEDLRVQSQNPTIIEALNALSFSWHSIAEDRQQYFQKRYISENPFPIGEREKLNNAKDGSLYSQAHQKYHPVFRNLRKERGYSDIFLFDRHGDLVYTVVKESDYATNLLVGPWRDTNLGRAFRAVHDAPGNAGQFFFDFELYGPSQGYPASFIANALFDEDGSFIGVLAFQLPIDRLNAVMQVSAGMGETGETFLVGRDFFRRSDSRFLVQSLILRHKIENDVVLRAIGGEKGTNTYRNQQGKNVFSAFDFIDFKGVRWALVAEIEEDEILAPVQRMKQDMLIGFVVIAVAVTLIGIAVSRRLAGPILRMTDAMSKLAIGDFNSELLLSNRKDEFGGMEQALRVFRENAIARSRVDVKLVEQAMLLKIVIENVAHGVALFDEDARLLVWNSRYLEYMGRKPGEITQGASFLEVAGYLARRGAYGEGDPEELVKKRLVLLKENKETKSEVVIGENDIFEVMSQRTPDGGFVVALTDVTTYREYQRKILLQRDDLERLNQQKNRFFSIIAHDLRNPFNALLGYSEYLKNGAASMSPDQVIEYAGSIHLAGQQTYDLLENLLEWSRVQMNKIVFEPQNLEVDDVITNAMSDLTSVIKDKQVKVSVRSDALQLIGDLGMTTIIVRNLLGNAIKFTNRRGAIVVTSERVDEFIHIHVKDNGIGMNSEALADLFNQERSQSTRGTDGEKGTGLGLLISKGFAEMQNGDILVDSQVGTGTTITLALPAALEV